MKSLKRIVILIIFIISIFCINNNVLAQSKNQLTLNKETIKKDEEVELNVALQENSIASMTLQIYFDTTKLEYLDKSENSNFVGNRVIYTWVDSSAGTKAKNTQTNENFYFKAIKDGIANIVVTGEYYNSEGKKMEIGDSNVSIKIGDKIEEKAQTQNKDNNANSENQNINDNNTNLRILRINEEGLSPEFQKDIKDYYFIADNYTNELQVTAIPENEESTVTITGNKDLKKGLNTINIKVESKDKTKTSNYKIYVTKTTNIELANSNLENLAVREGMIFPSFDTNITQYQIEIDNTIQKLDILAIPERKNAKVQITGNDKLQVGNNTITINVIAEDGITSKKYIIVAHRRNEQEQIQEEQEQQNQIEQLSIILENEQYEESNRNNKNNYQEGNKKTVYICIIIAILVAIAIIIYFKMYKKSKIKTKK